MSFNTELYSVEKGTINGDAYLFVVYNGSVNGHSRIGRVKTYTQAHDTMEAHANGKPLPIFAGTDPSDLAEQNAELRKKLTEKHDAQQNHDDNARLQRQLAEDNARLQRLLAEEHNKLVVPDLRRSEQAQQIIDLEQKVEYWKELSLSSPRYSKCGWSRDGQPLYTQEDVDSNGKEFHPVYTASSRLEQSEKLRKVFAYVKEALGEQR